MTFDMFVGTFLLGLILDSNGHECSTRLYTHWLSLNGELSSLLPFLIVKNLLITSGPRCSL